MNSRNLGLVEAGSRRSTRCHPGNYIPLMWMCVHCRSVIEDDEWETCWKCGRTRDVSAAGYEEEQKEVRKLGAELYGLREVLSRCSRCSGGMKFAGMRDLRHGYDGVLTHIERELLAFYHCERCGKVEWFKPDVGAEFRSEDERASK